MRQLSYTAFARCGYKLARPAAGATKRHQPKLVQIRVRLANCATATYECLCRALCLQLGHFTAITRKFTVHSTVHLSPTAKEDVPASVEHQRCKHSGLDRMKTINIQRGRMLSALGRVARPVAKTGLACISSAAISMGAGPAAHAEKVQVVETSLGLADQTRLLRHLGLRVGPDNDFVEAHFGPGGELFCSPADCAPFCKTDLLAAAVHAFVEFGEQRTTPEQVHTQQVPTQGHAGETRAEGGQFADGFLKYGEGKVAESEYLDVLPAGAHVQPSLAKCAETAAKPLQDSRSVGWLVRHSPCQRSAIARDTTALWVSIALSIKVS